ncbi:glycosyltransferase family 9 protein [Pigmentiphaga aceris]|uniref:Glycosyltransferase family 9 protein n=1 Tax=Pigmentiphaga aceris TaxID=1940612 RepID=A0A5C0AZA9_9BURK|nr:glycosyltransferase family 9 protein [Pigmentiphaga aceris]QEI06934.1 glycosyltransferase family 9 protein [Pigmentiphaga aceris]
MFGLSPRRDVTVATRFGERQLRAAAAGTEISVADVLISVHGEAMCIQHALDRAARMDAGLPETGSPASTHTDDLRLYTEAGLRAWPAWPMRLGRSVFLRAEDTAPTVLDTPAPLPAQLAQLRSRHPGKQHFRIALVNGFGGNLGDTMLGATAWRSVWPQLRDALGSVAVDALLGPGMPVAVAELIAHEDGIEQVSFLGPTLQQFARYDAYFDFTDLIDLPRYFDMAAVDWSCWWMGLDPTTIPATDKRNRLQLPDEAWQWARQRLAALPAPRVLFAWQASMPLRSMPEDSARRFVQALLAAAPHLTLLTDRPLGLVHPRMYDLGAEADSAEKMMALTAQADGLITVDSLAQHVADAAGVPTVMLLATLPHGRFPYYPAMRIVTPPGMEHLPGWGKVKVAEADWASMQGSYTQAWDAVDPLACWQLLQGQMAGRVVGEARVRTGAPWTSGSQCAWQPGAPFPHDRQRPVNAWMDQQLLDIARQLTLPGQTIVMASGDHDALATTLAARLGNDGVLHVFEPRRLRAQRLAAEAMHKGAYALHLHAFAAAASAGLGSIPDFDPASEADPASWGNSLCSVRIPMAPIDSLALEHCRLLLLRPPQDVLDALRGARGLLTRTRPVVLAGPVAPAVAQAIVELLAAHQYTVLGARHSPGDAVPVLLLATPQEQPIQAKGFAPITAVPAPVQ